MKVSSCPCSSFRSPAPLANYSICLLQNYFPQFPAYSRCPNITMYFPVSALLAREWQRTHLGKWLVFAVKKCNLLPLTQPPTHLIRLQIGLGDSLTEGLTLTLSSTPPRTLLLPFESKQQRKASGTSRLMDSRGKWLLSSGYHSVPVHILIRAGKVF